MGSVVIITNTSAGHADSSHDRSLSIAKAHIEVHAKFVHNHLGQNEVIIGK